MNYLLFYTDLDKSLKYENIIWALVSATNSKTFFVKFKDYSQPANNY